MLVEFGNAAPIDSRGARIDLGSPTVTYVHIPDTYTFESGIDVRDFLVHLADHPSVTHLPGHEDALAIADLSGGLWATHSAIDPTWVWSDNPVFESFLAEFYKLATPGKPSDVEDTHFTRFGPPGVGPWANPVEANITLAGRDIWARALGGGSVGAAGTATATSSTSLTNSGATWTTNQWQGMRVVSGGVWGNISSNTGTVLTVDRWYTPSNPGGSAGSTPGSTSAYVVIDGSAPGWFMGISADVTALSNPSTNTSLPGEITTTGGGLVRKICTYAHTAAANTYSLTSVFTANGSDVLPVTIGSIGVFTSMKPADTSSTMLLNTLLSLTATLSSVGDNLTMTDIVSGS